MILEGKAVGDEEYEENIYLALVYATADFPEAVRLISVCESLDCKNKGTKAWAFLEKRYAEILRVHLKSFLRGLLKPQDPHEPPEDFVGRVIDNYDKLKIIDVSLERIATHLLVENLRPEYSDVTRLMRRDNSVLEDLGSTMIQVLELCDLRDEENPPRDPRGPAGHAEARGRGRWRGRGGRSASRSAARSAPATGSGGSSSLPPGREEVCSYCSKPGHRVSKCHRLQADLESGKAQVQQGQGPGQAPAVPSAAEGQWAAASAPFVSLEAVRQVAAASGLGRDPWALDAAATEHCSSSLSDFYTYHPTGPVPVRGISCRAVGRGHIRIAAETEGGGSHEASVRDALYVPGLAAQARAPVCRVLSQVKLQERSRGSLLFDMQRGSFVCLGNGVKIPIRCLPGTAVFYLRGAVEEHPPVLEPADAAGPPLPAAPSEPLFRGAPPAVWHARFGHIGQQTLRRTLSSLRMPSFLAEVPAGRLCHLCGKSKDDAADAPEAAGPAPSSPFQEVEVGIWTASAVSVHGRKHVLGFVDCCTSFLYVRFLPAKSRGAVLGGFRSFLSFAGSIGCTVSVARLESDPALGPDIVLDFCRKHGIQAEFAPRRGPRHDSPQERVWSSLSESMHRMLQSAGLKLHFWEYALWVAAYVYNRTYRRECGGLPYELVFGKQPDVTLLRTFGCPARIAGDAAAAGPAEPQDAARRGIFVGYRSKPPFWQVYVPSDGSVVASDSVLFDELFAGDISGLEEQYTEWRVERQRLLPVHRVTASGTDAL